MMMNNNMESDFVNVKCTEGTNKVFRIDMIALQKAIDDQLKSCGTNVDWNKHYIPPDEIHTPFYGHENKRKQYIDIVIRRKDIPLARGFEYTDAIDLKWFLENQKLIKRKVKIDNFLESEY